MASWTTIPNEARGILSKGIQKEIQGNTIQGIEQWRDEKLVGLLQLIYGKHGGNA